MTTPNHSDAHTQPAGLGVTMLLAACAGGLAWGIRGQYGHETGAMIAGILVGFSLVLLHGRNLSGLQNARAIALFAIGISIGGSQTIGQTIGLTQNSDVLGNVEAYRWGMLGLAVKGGLWISLGAAMFGMGLSGKRYGWSEVTLLALTMTGGLLAGTQILNQPFDPEHNILPKVYFSRHWRWEPLTDAPRRECWGGVLGALVVLLSYLAIIKRDALAWKLGLWGCIAGAIGFPAGQAVQAYNAWHAEWVQSLPTHVVTVHFNWWNMMETTFGCVFGAIVGLGVWMHRRAITPAPAEQQSTGKLPLLVELLLLAVHVRLLIAWNFQSIDWLDIMADRAIPMLLLPLILTVAGRYGAFLIALPITLLPIAGKTLKQLSFNENTIPISEGLDLYVAAPLLLATSVAIVLAVRARGHYAGKWFGPIGLVTTTWLYFYLNDAFFHSPWIWKRPWDSRTPNGFLFFVFAVCLTIAAAWYAPDLDNEDVVNDSRAQQD